MSRNHRISIADIPASIQGVTEAVTREEFLRAPFTRSANVVRFRRPVTGAYDELAMALLKKFGSASDNRLYFKDDVEPSERHQKGLVHLYSFQEKLRDDKLRKPLQTILDDVNFLKRHSRHDRVEVRIVRSYGEFATVNDPHADRSSAKTGRVTCCYTPPVTHGYLISDIEYDRDGNFVRVKDAATPVDFNVGDLSRHAVSGQKNTLPYIHFAEPSKTPRILLIGDCSIG